MFALSDGPATRLVWAALTNRLSADPLAELTNETGVWALRFLALTLALTPLRRLTKWNAFARFRRMMGLFAFFYGTLHFLRYVIADRFAGLDFPQGIVAWTTARLGIGVEESSDAAKRPLAWDSKSMQRVDEMDRSPRNCGVAVRDEAASKSFHSVGAAFCTASGRIGIFALPAGIQ